MHNERQILFSDSLNRTYLNFPSSLSNSTEVTILEVPEPFVMFILCYLCISKYESMLHQ